MIYLPSPELSEGSAATAPITRTSKLSDEATDGVLVVRLRVRNDEQMRWLPSELTRWRLRRRFRQGKQNLANSLQWVWTSIGPAWPAIAVVVVLVAILLPLWSGFSGFDERIKGIYIAAWGTVFDIFCAGVILTIFAVIFTRRERRARHLEEIDDLKKWDSEEARLRIAGSIRRLAKLGKTDIDFSGITLRNFSFYAQDIESLRGSIFSLGVRIDRMSANSTVLENVDFSHVDCRGVVFSKSLDGIAALGLNGKNLAFSGAKLNGACFEGAKLSWTDYRADESEWYVDEGEDDDGHSMRDQVYYPAFSEADLNGCSFRYAELDHADFRDAVNILKVDFTGASGLHTCFFDEEVRQRIIDAVQKGCND
ncbi:MAG TPA: pentapeptide repeat-containing protein [Stellaceae bacterium]|nr:pentapeptide repeat-containing protein [Stellaceae bacterium]